MATVITNLLSAIPIFGKDLVELKNKLTTIGKISVHAFKNGRVKRSDKEKNEFLSIPYPFLAMLIGLIDGDGCIIINKTTKGYIKINLTIEFNIRDLSILQYIHSILKLGKITVYSKFGICKLVINRTDIQEILFPLFLHHKLFFLTNTRREQFNKAMFILQNNIKMFIEIPSIFPIIFSLPLTALDYTELPFFNNWIVGFTIAEKYPGYLEYLRNNFYKDIINYKKNKNICDETKSLIRIYKKENRKNIKLFLATQQGTRKISFLTKPIIANKIVIWGIILTSTVGYGRFTKQIRNMIALPFFQQSILIGILLSDGYLWSDKPYNNYRFHFKQTFSRFEYVLYVFQYFSHYCNILPFLKIESGYRDNKKYNYSSIEFYTRAFPCFTQYNNLFYKNKIKVLPEDIFNLLTPVALAHWIMGDGAYKSHDLILCTDSFSILEVVKLINVLIIRYELECKIHFHTSTQPRILIRQRSMLKLKNIVLKYMHYSMLYKIIR